MSHESISSAKNNLSALIKQVQGGDPVLITDRGVPVARLESVQLGAGVPPRIVALAQSGLVRLPRHDPDTSWLDLPLPAPVAGPTASELLLEERRHGR
ncbi:MAG: type II toxin-antitoxin system prevent-host-death family antitoxin [Gemmatimonadota bacterium]|nr:type II toxin-antitoxin system prevent-host-death family antitoxin [Gemmatimonadota bacterium]